VLGTDVMGADVVAAGADIPAPGKRITSPHR
jgi:hypothetical protein